MKIFISHSSKDKWAARRISDELRKSGAETFLDEKDIKTGQSIDSEIKKHLKNCDDFLIIISPASLKSEWVLIELGGAIALEKTIIPILLYVGANEIPQIINLKLARDINEIELYYTEITQRIKTVPANKPHLLKSINTSKKYKKGQRIKIVSNRQPNIYRDNLTIDWEDDMDAYLGQETTIRAPLFDETYALEIDKGARGHGFIWADEWLVPLEK
jgi:hypothetical protein